MKGIVWGTTKERCGHKLKSLIEDYKLYWNINHVEIQETRNRVYVKFENGDVWEAYVATKDNCRGRKCNISFVDSDIDIDILRAIECSTVCPPYSAITYF